MEPVTCSFCRGPWHVASGDVIGDRRDGSKSYAVCGACVKPMAPWLKGHLNRKWSKEAFYLHANTPPPAAPHIEVCFQLRKAGYKAYLVGGCVRDELLGRTPKDYDVATDARPEIVVNLFPEVIPTGIQHGTVTVMVEKTGVEVTTFRSEGKYTDGRRPDSVTYGTSIEEDLARRDFTINAMAQDPFSGEITDPFGGQTDLKAGVVRCVRDPMERFAEDGLRCLRAVRFASVYCFTIDPATREAIRPNLLVFSRVAAERVTSELMKIMGSDWVNYGVDALSTTGLLDAIFGHGNEIESRLKRYLEGEGYRDLYFIPKERPELRLAMLLREFGSCPVERLKLPAKTEQRVREVFANRVPDQLHRSAVELRQWASRVGLELAKDLALAEGEEDVGFCLDKMTCALTTRQLALDGNKIIDIIGAKGKAVGQAQKYLLDRVLEDPSLNTSAQLAQLLSQWKVSVVQSALP